MALWGGGSLPFIQYNLEAWTSHFSHPFWKMVDILSLKSEGASILHSLFLIYLLGILATVAGLFLSSVISPYLDSQHLESNSMEVMGTVIPIIILLLMVTPSMKVLYWLETWSFSSSWVKVKIVGHQWFWSYEVSDFASNKLFSSAEYDSYILHPDSGKNHFNLLADNAVFLPAGEQMTLFISSEDVIHSWSVPSMGVKLDAIPGRLNSIHLTGSYAPGVYYGQCSEICGMNHSLMPTVVYMVGVPEFTMLNLSA